MVSVIRMRTKTKHSKTISIDDAKRFDEQIKFKDNKELLSNDCNNRFSDFDSSNATCINSIIMNNISANIMKASDQYCRNIAISSSDNNILPNSNYSENKEKNFFEFNSCKNTDFDNNNTLDKNSTVKELLSDTNYVKEKNDLTYVDKTNVLNKYINLTNEINDNICIANNTLKCEIDLGKANLSIKEHGNIQENDSSTITIQIIGYLNRIAIKNIYNEIILKLHQLYKFFETKSVNIKTKNEFEIIYKDTLNKYKKQENVANQNIDVNTAFSVKTHHANKQILVDKLIMQQKNLSINMFDNLIISTAQMFHILKNSYSKILICIYILWNLSGKLRLLNWSDNIIRIEHADALILEFERKLKNDKEKLNEKEAELNNVINILAENKIKSELEEKKAEINCAKEEIESIDREIVMLHNELKRLEQIKLDKKNILNCLEENYKNQEQNYIIHQKSLEASKNALIADIAAKNEDLTDVKSIIAELNDSKIISDDQNNVLALTECFRNIEDTFAQIYYNIANITSKIGLPFIDPEKIFSNSLVQSIDAKVTKFDSTKLELLNIDNIMFMLMTNLTEYSRIGFENLASHEVIEQLICNLNNLKHCIYSVYDKFFVHTKHTNELKLINAEIAANHFELEMLNKTIQVYESSEVYDELTQLIANKNSIEAKLEEKIKVKGNIENELIELGPVNIFDFFDKYVLLVNEFTYNITETVKKILTNSKYIVLNELENKLNNNSVIDIETLKQYLNTEI